MATKPEMLLSDSLQKMLPACALKEWLAGKIHFDGVKGKLEHWVLKNVLWVLRVL